MGGFWNYRMAATGDLGVHAGRYGILLTQGTFYTTGLQLQRVGCAALYLR